jgi:hypothetical protein
MQGMTSLLYTAENNQPDEAVLLLEKGADTEIKDMVRAQSSLFQCLSSSLLVRHLRTHLKRPFPSPDSPLPRDR